ncbi:DUF1294 domain-containing protein [Shewanella sp. Isolate7]|uniref:DUF1294 domain-containing protein n=1 Tax=Shewanella sp. Isolate7 TaxID=2908528 RepID=UPI001EFE93DE|nr:DUF1294 domain-containing protein [Shewanella sp. Isolate7]MCG9722622.1 DUF1294 domain-containing protein [Shewanella sp. Isolate7]
MSSKIFTGTLSQWHDDKGYGFIKPNGSGAELFVHISSFRGHVPQKGQALKYHLSQDKQGRPCAELILSKARRTSNKTPSSRLGFKFALRLLLAAALFIGLFFAAIMQRLPMASLLYFAVLSLITYMAYAVDKSAAQKGSWRIQESSLHLLSLLGGWPGAMLGQQHLRHKSSKRAFRLVLWLTVIINLSLLGAVISPLGQALLTRLGVN